MRCLIPLSELFSSFDKHLVRFQSFLELFLFSLNLSLKYNCFFNLDKMGHTVFCLFKCIPISFCLALSGFLEKFVPSLNPFQDLSVEPLWQDFALYSLLFQKAILINNAIEYFIPGVNYIGSSNPKAQLQGA